ncbi:peptidoglycan DD-metalloendopeptidase family protein [Aromatoleum diolicum]|uniref:Peptidoglycan DD-metalloendopeptidase family protein n=2 Tax=Aromatoleum diolicum TaxID=75796 RepID=A0ABX1QHI3_9RHOO|nr:M23 family metallopeptidase [Aromatoleum diolicum]NMG76510.1 peptidoglycan DD-metalloendopeptidase family protein [Aromatoleum diolicum]
MQARKVRILAELSDQLPSSRRRGWVLGAVVSASMLGVVAATAVVPGDAPMPFPAESVIEQLGPVKVETVEQRDLPFVSDERVLPGDTIHTIFRRIGVSDQEALDFLNQTEGMQAQRQLRAGRSLFAVVNADGRLVSLSLPVSGGDTRFTIERTTEGFRARAENPAAIETHVEMRSGTIRQTLFGATDAAGIPDSVATKLAEIFGTEIDFSSDLRRGDEFRVVYETIHNQGIATRAGRILAAEFVNQGKSHTVVLHRDADGSDTYYTPDGRGLNQAFLRYPLEFSRISSNFGRRLHPVHKSWRAHNGTDFAAPTGTPVKAASNGTVEYVGSQRGYGNIVVLQHRDRYETAYAHLNGFVSGLRKGERVRQGDVIGYVGSTGWSTGAHLHFEIRVNGVAEDPMKIALPSAQPLEKQALATFKRETGAMFQRLALLSRTDVAKID